METEVHGNSHQQPDEIPADFSALARTIHLDDAVAGFGHAAAERDSLGVPQVSSELPRVPGVPCERHQTLWTHPQETGGSPASCCRQGSWWLYSPGRCSLKHRFSIRV